ncbi:MAG: ATP-binding cassette domain-containing protein [Lachnospiraceae bacterium]|nr:ATP-binding cassette domain-containing protein [Lachnospiraceae bacterium]
MALLRFERVNFCYPESEKQVLKEVFFSIEQGEFVLLCGASGCGKTTLLRHVLKSQIPVGTGDGEMIFDGNDIERMPDEEAARRISFVGQDPEASVITETVWQELAFGLESLGTPVEQMRRRTAEIAEYFGLGKLFRRNTAELSGGQKQLLQLASAMVMQPELLVLDEPTSQLDPIGAGRFLETLVKLNRDFGVTILLSEQRLEGVLPLADKVLVMDEGQVEVCTPRECSMLLQEKGSAVLSALPVASRVAMEWKGTMYGKSTPKQESIPLTIREGQMWLRKQRNVINEKRKKDFSVRDDKTEINMESKENVLIQTRHISFAYNKGELILRDFNWKLQKGSIYCILGSNGSGKSTLLKLLAGIYKPQGGRIISKARIIYLPQNPKAVFSDISVEEELAQFLLRKQLSQKEMIDKTEEMLAFMDLTKVRNNHPYDLSGGQAQRLAIAKALLTEPEILLLDEPTKGLDAAFKKTLGKYLQKMTDRGITVVLVSHDLEFCAEYSTHCGLLFDGEMICQGYTEEFFRDNYFYVPAATRMADGIWEDVLTGEDIVKKLSLDSNFL